MEPKWAAENLQVIRTLMERSAIYRRALGPIMIVAGGIGLIASIVPCFSPIHSSEGFVLFWMSISIVVFFAALLLVRRQALKDAEVFWSPPTRRVTLALTPAFLTGMFVGILFAMPTFSTEKIWLLPSIWMICYGCGLHAAGFFMQRGIRLFGLVFVLAGSAVLVAGLGVPKMQSAEIGHYIMGIFFGLAHIAFGSYLYFSEKRKNAA